METNGFFIANALKTDENFNILIVDDDLVILEILKKTLESVTNFNIFTADNPGLALDLVKNNDIDLSITDCFLPLINGLELIKNINDIKPDIPSIMISGSVDPEIIVKSINSNMVFGFLKKPVKDKELISMVYKALEIKILKRENKKYKRELEEKNIILEENKFRLCSILLNITDGVLILFPDGKIDLMNAKIQRLFFGRENSCYNIYSIYEISGFDSLKNKIRNFIDGKEENLRFEEDISDDIYSIHLSKFRNNGKLIGISVIFIDVTKEKEVDKLKMEFIANISHELKTPLASIQGFTEILLKAPNLQAEKREEFLNIVFKEALRLSKMVNSILDFSKIEFEKEVPKFENVDLLSLASEVVFLLREKAESKNLNLIFESKTEKKYVFSNKDMLKEALINLTENAVKYTKNGGLVRVSLFETQKGLKISIKDNGPGIPEEEHKNIFKKFYRIKGSKEKGTGLGLSIVKSICEKLNIKMFLISGLGEGCEFILEFTERAMEEV